MRVLLTLVRKELRQHWAALLVLALLSFLGYALILVAHGLTGQTGSVFESLRVFVMILVVLGGLVLCHRLVVVEYSARTQLFLEALPVSRWRMVAVKYCLGLVLIAGIVGFGLALACGLGWRHEVLTLRFVSILAARAFTAAICAYHFFFLMGFLGRYRLALYVTAIIGLYAVSELTDLRLDHFGPMALLDQRFPYESERFPVDALQTTWVLNVVFLAVAFLLALTREGNVAALLAEKMSHREKVFVAALLLGLLFAASVLGEKKKRAPFDLHEAVTQERAGVVAKVSSSVMADSQAQALAREVADAMVSARAYLDIPNLPPVFLTRRSDLDAHRYERGELEQASGVHVQANFTAPQFRKEEFIAWLIRETLLVHTEGRAQLEPKAWVLDGFAPIADHPDQPAGPLARDRKLALCALYGADAGFSPSDLREWYRFRERVGAHVAQGVAWSGLRAMARHAGPERTRRFLQAVLGAEVPKDVRALWHERSAPMDRLLETEAGLAPTVFWAQWQEELALARRELGGELARLPRLKGEVRFLPTSRDSRRATYQVRIEPPPPEGVRYSLLYYELPVFDEEVAPQALRREQNLYSARPSGELPDNFTRGGRFYWSFSLEVPALGGEVISGWKREEIP